MNSHHMRVFLLTMIAMLTVSPLIGLEGNAEAAVLAVCSERTLSRYDIVGGVATNGNTVYSIPTGGVRDVSVDSLNDHIYYIEAQSYRQRVWRDNNPYVHDPNFGDSDLLVDFDTNSYFMEHLSIDPLRGKLMTQTEERAFASAPHTWLNRYDIETGGFEETIYNVLESQKYLIGCNAGGYCRYGRHYYHEIEDIAVDPIGGKVYWTDRTEGTIRRMNLDGSFGAEIVYQNLINPESLALDVGAGRLFFTDEGDATHLPGIYSGDMSGAGAVGVAVAGFASDQYFGGIDVDPSTARVYWTQTGAGGGASTVYSADYNGGNQAQLLNAGGSPISGNAISLGCDPGVAPGNPLMPDPNNPDDDFVFDAVPVPHDQIIFFDPDYAIGYDYSVTGSDFASLLLPNVGDGVYDLHLWDGSVYAFEQQLGAGEEFFFGGSGVNRFRIVGIEETAQLNPDDPLAFVTGLSFTSAGTVDVTMTPLTEIAIPEPASITLLAIALLGLSMYTRRIRCG